MEARDYRRIAREKLSGNWGISIAVAFVAALLGGLVTNGGGSFNLELDQQTLQHLPETVITILKVYFSIAAAMGFVNFIIGGTVQLGYCHFLLKQYNGEEVAFTDLFSQFHQFANGFLQSLLRGIYIFLWSLLFIIPGIVKSFAYAMTPFILVEHPDYTANEAITASRELMDGHKGELFWLGLTFFGWILLSVLTLGIGTLFLNPYMNAAHAAFYKHLTRGSYAEY